MEQKEPIFGHRELVEELAYLCATYPRLRCGSIGTSILGREIPLLSIGTGRKCVLYIGGHHGMEWITAKVLTDFAEELLSLLAEDRSVFGTSVSLLCELYTFHILPMLNPDGIDYQLHGPLPDNPLYERLLAMNGGSTDFSHWQANARGVDLNHNYDAGFEEYKRYEAEHDMDGGAPTKYSGERPESEPETKHLCDLIRFLEGLGGVLTLHTQGEEIYYAGEPEHKALGERIAGWTDYTLAIAEGTAAFGGLTDWCVEKMRLPAFTLECGSGVNPLPLEAEEEIRRRLKKLLFLFPTLL